MDIIIYSAVTLILWVLSVSLLLPFVIALKFSKRFRDKMFRTKWFSRVLMEVFGFRFSAWGGIRRRAFDHLREQLRRRKRETPLEILEIGFGGGYNLPFYPKNSNLTFVDENDSFVKKFEENRTKYPQVTYKKTVIAMAEDMHTIDDESFDVVVCTYVLCSVRNVQLVLNEVKRVLKRRGKFLFIEHVLYPTVFWKAALQKLINPLWKIYFDGCNLTRETDEEIRDAGFLRVMLDKVFLKDVLLYVKPHIVGIATK